jgi:hypothetical protein
MQVGDWSGKRDVEQDLVALPITSGSFAMAGQSKHFRSAYVQRLIEAHKFNFATSAPLLQNCLLQAVRFLFVISFQLIFVRLYAI